MASEAKAGRESQVGAQCAYLDNMISQLCQEVEGLEERLGGVLQNPTPVAKDEAEQASLVEHAATIRGFGERVSKVRDQVQSMISRLEI